ncbi:MAG: HDOD domain-containing protein [Desulfobacula sp.]|nr:HDOD domain-containing protein [Desulfobacula sp.]
MGQSGNPHAGIELDVIDLTLLPKLDGMVPDNLNIEVNNREIQLPDYKVFVKSLFSKIVKNASLLSFSRQVDNVNRILKMKYSSADDVAQVILNDVNLTSKLLKLVNSSFYGQFSTKGITTIAEAMIILGTEEIKLAAANLKIYELMNNISNIKILKDKTIKGLQRSVIVRQIALYREYKNTEALQVSAMLYDLGEYLVALFYPDKYAQIEILMDGDNISKEKASKHILGLPYSYLGMIVGKKWNLPDTIINAMRPLNNRVKMSKRLTMQDLQRHMCAFANEICESSQTHTGKELNKKLDEISHIYKNSLNLDVSTTIELLKHSWKKTKQYTTVINAN